LSERSSKSKEIRINDNLADGTDVSWLWDVDVEKLAKRCHHVVVGGLRAGDMAVRLKYAGVPGDRIELVETVEQGIDRGLAGIPNGGTLYALPTYTAMLELRAIASKRHYAESFWKT
jgi:UDP-N-acetylmuramyl tripeptide synthase